LASITRADVLRAIDQLIDIPKTRKSKDFCVEHEGLHYAPKALLSYASNGRLQPGDFSGGPETNEKLKALGFEVVDCNCGGLLRSVPSDPARGKSRVSRLGEIAQTKPESPQTEPKIARLVVRGRPAFSVSRAAASLRDVINEMQKREASADVLLTPGGFIRLKIAHLEPIRGWRTPREALGRITALCDRELAPLVARLTSGFQPARFVTLGVDVCIDDHGFAELIATVDVRAGTISHWTGKSYPANYNEEHHLVHITDQQTHLQVLGGTRYLVLGCHDLNFVQPRTKAKGQRKARALAMHTAARSFRPDVVLQHPHQTDTAGTWRGGWAKLTKMLKPRAYASGIAYWPQPGETLRKPLDQVLKGTARGDVIDYVWSSSGRVTVRAL